MKKTKSEIEKKEFDEKRMIEYINNNITSTQQAHKDKAKAEEENLKLLRSDLEMDKRYERTVEDRKN